MVPPQESPTFQAVSSATPNSSILGLPLSITSSASVTTAPSTQPPDTEPRKFSSLSMTRFEPTGRGAEPQVSTTVASATSRPFLRHSSAALRMSVSVVSIKDLSSQIANGECRIANGYKIGVTFSIRYSPLTPPSSSHLPQPGLGIGGAAAAFERGDQAGHRVQIVNRAHFVDVRQHGLDAARTRLEA